MAAEGEAESEIVLETTWPQVLAWRMRRGLLDPVGQPTVPDIVRQLCGVQAQVPAAAALAVGVRQADPVAGAVDEALGAGDVMRCWAMRGTLHLLTADEAGAHLALMAAGRSWEKGSWVKTFGVTPDEMVELTDAVAAVLDDQVLTREQLVAAVGERLGRADVEDELRSGWGAVLKPVAWQGVLCHGPPDGNRVTFARPDRLLPAWAGLPEPDEAAQVVIPAYLRTYGPATADRFDAWLTRGVSRKGLLRGWFAAVADRLVTVDVEGTVAYLLADDVDELAGTPTPSPEEAAATVRLLPAFDQHVLGPGTAATEIIRPGRRKEVSRAAGWIAPVVVAGGRVVGVWEVGDDKTRARCACSATATATAASRSSPPPSTRRSSGCARSSPPSLPERGSTGTETERGSVAPVSTGGTWDSGWGDGPSDGELIAAVGDRSHDALGAIYQRYGAAVWSIATQVCRGTEQAEEVSAAVFTELWSQPERFDPARGGLRAWLVARAHARAVALVRAEDAANATPPSAEVETATHAEALPKEARRALDRLPAVERDAILLTYVGGHTCGEAARLLGVPVATIKSSVRRGLTNLRGALDAEGVSR